jgi:hypothetical protein
MASHVSSLTIKLQTDAIQRDLRFLWLSAIAKQPVTDIEVLEKWTEALQTTVSAQPIRENEVSISQSSLVGPLVRPRTSAIAPAPVNHNVQLDLEVWPRIGAKHTAVTHPRLDPQ